MANTSTFCLDIVITRLWSFPGLSAATMAEILPHSGHYDSALVPSLPPAREPIPPPPPAGAAPLVCSHSPFL